MNENLNKKNEDDMQYNNEKMKNIESAVSFDSNQTDFN